MQRYIKKILEARVYDIAVETPMEEARGLSERLGNRVLLKREDEQPVFSFKIRGAYNKMSQLNEEEKARGVIAASAGNHAQGVAAAARHLGIKATIVMPKTSPDVKVANVRRLGGKAVLHGDTFDEARAHSLKLMEEKGLVYIHPYDDPDVIAGQGTIAMEILRQESGPIHAIFVPVGGGGLIAGIASYVKYLRPETRVIGVESNESACLALAMEKGFRDVLDQVGIFADGVAVAQIGEYNWEVAKDYVDEVITVTTDEICAAIKDIFDDTRTIAEPAGALSVAGLKKYVQREQLRGRHLLAIESGANMNFDRLRHVAERAELGERREALLAVRIPEKPGSFLRFCRALGRRSITEFNYRYSDTKEAHVFVGIELEQGREERERLILRLTEKGYSVIDMTENETAKLHIRYMVGGHAPCIEHERLYRFEFPERPGALLDFLTQIGKRWDISLFHYRNHGAAFGRVLMGAEIEPGQEKAFRQLLDKVGFAYWEEGDNPAYRLFASPGCSASG